MTGPRGNYTSGPKRHYRREVWAFIERVLRSSVRDRILKTFSAVAEARADRRVLVLESSSGFEVDELLRRGYQAPLIHVVNHSPGIVATVQRQFANDPRMGGRLQTHGSSLDVALDHCKQRGLLFDAMNLDFTGCVTKELLRTIAHAAALIKPCGAMAVAVSRGREPWIDQIGPGDGDPHRKDAFRLRGITHAASAGRMPPDQMGCQWHAGISKWGAYRGHNSRTSMLWAGMQLIPHTAEIESCWSTLDAFLPACCLDVLLRRNVKASPDLSIVYRYEDGRGARLFVHASLEDILRTQVNRGVQIHTTSFNRPEILNRWAALR